MKKFIMHTERKVKDSAVKDYLAWYLSGHGHYREKNKAEIDKDVEKLLRGETLKIDNGYVWTEMRLTNES